ncbi:hypothetical protein E2C01_102443 [Portunus trituberculatus]|uniref:Uncharacterized protein n=1 Tax=Portunus trituberculatus TaxID=210409 RepID=A0A5B7KHB8_PORTR|nr:hypothetical protein [Portunus trituberculatus]
MNKHRCNLECRRHSTLPIFPSEFLISTQGRTLTSLEYLTPTTHIHKRFDSPPPPNKDLHSLHLTHLHSHHHHLH